MADKRIDQLTAATTMGDDDLLVLQQNNQAKKLPGSVLSDYVYDVVEVSNTQPTESRNKVWIKPSTEDLVLAEQADVDELKAALMGDGSLKLDKSDVRNAYPSNTIGEVVSFTSSTASICYNRIIPVENGVTYTISVTNGETVASTNWRYFVVVDSDNIVRDVYGLNVLANKNVVAEITPTVNGWLILCVDKNTVDITIKGYSAKTAIENLETIADNTAQYVFSGNYIPVDSFTRHGNATTYTTTPNSVYMATTKTNAYVGTSTPADGLKSILKVGHKYRLHAKLDSYSASAVNRAVIVRGIEGNADGSAAPIYFSHLGEGYVDFVATGYESYVTLFLSGPSSAKGQNVQYSDIWLKEIIAESAVDVAARDELNEIEPKNLFNKGFCPAFIVNKNTGELETATNAGNTASDYIEVEPNTQYFLNCNYNSTAGTKGMAFYDEDKTYISGSLMSPSGGSGRYPFVFVTPADTKYLRFSFWRNEADIYKVDTLYLGKYDEALEKKYGLSNDFNGEKLSLGSSIKVTTLNSFNPSTYGTPQGGDVYGNQLFGFCDNLTKNFVYDLDAMTIQSVAYNGSAVDNHANVATFGNAKYDANDTYPLIYISSEREKYLGVFRILDSNGYEITELSRIYYPSEIPNTYASGIVDKENNRICLAAILPSVSADKKIYFYNLPDSYDADITLESDEYSEQHPYGYIGSVDYNGKFNAATGTALYTQDCFVFNNKLYRGNGSEGTGSLNVISLEDGSLLTYANISGTVTGEPEIMAKYGERIIVISAQGVIYSIVDT